MTQRIPWTRVFGEGLVIVVSILLGLGINAWWDDRQAASLEADILSALAVEIATNQETLRSNTDDIEADLGLLERFLKSEPEALTQMPADSTLSIVTALASYRTFEPQSGNALLLSEAALLSPDGIAIRAMVSEWLTEVSDAAEEGEEFRRRAQAVLDLTTIHDAGLASWLPGAALYAAPGVLVEMRRDDALVQRVELKAGAQLLYASILRGRLSPALDSLTAVLARAR